jgi:uncharacterized membrane protein YhaH (DUF805 family)
MNAFLKTRINRATYWALLLPVTLLVTLAVAFLPKPPGVVEIAMIAFGVPRLHDLGRSGWWMVVPIGFEIVAVALGAVLGGINGILVAGGLVLLVIAAMMIVIGIIPGNAGANAFGAPPPPGLSMFRGSRAAP